MPRVPKTAEEVRATRDRVSLAYRRRHADRVRQRSRAWYEANKDLYLEYSAVRRARKRAGFVATVRRLEIFERDRGLCGICGDAVDPDNWHLDHVVPLAVGGTHEPANVQVAHPACNWAKGGRIC